MEILNDTIDFSAYFRETDHKTKVKPAYLFVEEAKERLHAQATVKHTYLPWEKTKQAFEFRRGEVTMWSGQNGHGKTLVTTQVVLSLMGQDEKACVASFEMKPHATVGRMVRMYAGTNPFSPEYQRDGMDALDSLYDEFGEWSKGRLWLYDQNGTANPETVLGMVKYCATELGITHVVIDSLMKCVANEDDYNGQKAFIDQCCALARDCDIHLHIVHHLKKPANEGAMPDKHDTKGTGAITDQIDNLFMVWRNKPKEDAARANKGGRTEEPDAFLLIRKQRNYPGSGDGEPAIKLWLERDSAQFKGDPGDPVMFFPNYPHRETSYP